MKRLFYFSLLAFLGAWEGSEGARIIRRALCFPGVRVARDLLCSSLATSPGRALLEWREFT